MLFEVVNMSKAQGGLMLQWSYGAGRGEVSAKLLVLKP